MSQRRLYILLFIITNVTVFYITPIMYSFRFDMFPFCYFLLRAALLILSILLLPLVFKDAIKDAKSKLKSGLFSMLIVSLFLFYTSELLLTFYPETNGKNDTYCAKTWNYYYWNQNKLGFRDIEFETIPANNTNIFFAGDSYTEGHGIKDPTMRVSDLCRKKLLDFNIYNIGKCGMDINDEVDLIKHIPIHAEIIVLQICSNDWDYLSSKLSIKTPVNKVLLAQSNSFTISKYSVLFNYLNSKLNNVIENLFSSNLGDNELIKVYNTFKINKSDYIKSKNNLNVLEYAVTHSPLPEDSIQNKLFAMFNEFSSSLKIMTDTALFANYLNKLNELNDFCETNKTKLIIVPYPNMDNFSMKVGNKYINNYLCKLISKQGINCVDIYPVLKRANLSSYTVNSSDNHINAKASAIVADTLIAYLHHNILK